MTCQIGAKVIAVGAEELRLSSWCKSNCGSKVIAVGAKVIIIVSGTKVTGWCKSQLQLFLDLNYCCTNCNFTFAPT